MLLHEQNDEHFRNTYQNFQTRMVVTLYVRPDQSGLINMEHHNVKLIQANPDSAAAAAMRVRGEKNGFITSIGRPPRP